MFDQFPVPAEPSRIDQSEQCQLGDNSRLPHGKPLDRRYHANRTHNACSIAWAGGLVTTKLAGRSRRTFHPEEWQKSPIRWETSRPRDADAIHSVLTLLTLVGGSRSDCHAWRKPFDTRTLRVVNRPC